MVIAAVALTINQIRKEKYTLTRECVKKKREKGREEVSRNKRERI